mmetsp:Transcript_6576/g.27065  ORF Transcript_6576/g.27065 Transcript_6576/m.27065 type:complete len:378 (-) Transcript_6576:270-1403(-)
MLAPAPPTSLSASASSRTPAPSASAAATLAWCARRGKAAAAWQLSSSGPARSSLSTDIQPPIAGRIDTDACGATPGRRAESVGRPAVAREAEPPPLPAEVAAAVPAPVAAAVEAASRPRTGCGDPPAEGRLAGFGACGTPLPELPELKLCSLRSCASNSAVAAAMALSAARPRERAASDHLVATSRASALEASAAPRHTATTELDPLPRRCVALAGAGRGGKPLAAVVTSGSLASREALPWRGTALSTRPAIAQASGVPRTTAADDPPAAPHAPADKRATSSRARETTAGSSSRMSCSQRSAVQFGSAPQRSTSRPADRASARAASRMAGPHTVPSVLPWCAASAASAPLPPDKSLACERTATTRRPAARAMPRVSP